MALSPEQKAANKEWQKVRDRAYRARYKEVSSFEAMEEARLDSEFGPKIDAACAAEDALRNERNAKLADIDRQIAELTRKKHDIAQEYEHPIAVARGGTSALVNERNRLRSEVMRRLAEQFPDMAGSGRWSAACWGETEYAKRLLAKKP